MEIKVSIVSTEAMITEREELEKMGFFEREQKINAGLNTPNKIYLENSKVHIKRGEEMLTRNDLERALLEFKYAVIYSSSQGQSPNERAVNYLRGEKLGSLNMKRTNEAQSLFDKGRACLERRDYNKAITLFSKAINLCPITAVPSFAFRGKALLMTNRNQEAIDDFSIVLQYAPNVAEGYFNRGQAYLKVGNSKAARKDFQMAIRLDPQYKEANKMLQDENRHPSKEPLSRWYFLSLGWAMAPQIFQALCRDEEFASVDAGSALPEAKVLVRYYKVFDSGGPEQPPYRLEETEELGLLFRGFAFPLSSKGLLEKIDGLKDAYWCLSGPNPSGKHVIINLADDRFDTIMRGYHDLLNTRYMQSGVLPIVKLIYTDDFESAKNLLLLYQLIEKSTCHEDQFKVWCTKKGIAPETFSTTK